MINHFYSSLRSKYISDIIIIGSGIVGSSCALELSKKGYKVNVLDKNNNNNEGTTSYSSGICRMYYTHIDSVKLAWDSYQYWYKDNWEELIGSIDKRGMVQINECGSIYLDTINSNSFIKKTTKAMSQANVPYEYLDLKETKKLLSKLNLNLEDSFQPLKMEDDDFGKKLTSPIYGALYMPVSGYISDPILANSNLQYGATQNNCNFYNNCEVKSFLTSGKNNNIKVYGVKTSDNDLFYAPIIINCAGPYSSIVNKILYENIDIENDSKITTKPMRQEVCYIKAPKDINVEQQGLIICDSDIGVHFRPETGNKFLIGNSEPPCDKFKFLNHPNELNKGFSEQYDQQLYRGSLRMPYVPLSGETQGVVSMYDVTEDWTPIYDKSNVQGYYQAIGTSGNQFKNAPNIGKIMSKIISTKYNTYYETTNKNNPLMFDMKYFNDKINLGSFSRLRKLLPNSNSVFS